MAKRKPKARYRCQWAGHGRHHHGPVAFEITLGRPCGHESTGPIPTCWQQGQIMLAEHGRASIESRCRVCLKRSAIQVVDPDIRDHHNTP